MLPMVKLDTFLACQRKIRKATLKRLLVKDKIGITRTSKEPFPDNLEERTHENKIPRYWRNKDEDLIEPLNQKRDEQEKSLQKKSGQDRSHQEEDYNKNS